MRLHSLSLQAFGPFAEAQTVDFDELNDAGVFLLTGATGAGKTSVLDAVCFALYGVVPGDREVRGLRSAHAGPDVPTRVCLELTLGGRRLRVERWPEWERPKKRGSGTTTERAGATLVELGPDGSEHLVSSRVQEVGHELAPLLGMTSEQFKQVVLLPQGGFSTFLKADSDQRRDVLERLFATQRFTRIEGWVQEHASRLRRRADEARDELLQLLAAMEHRAECPRPEQLDETSLAHWRAAVLDRARQAVDTASGREAAASRRCETAREHEQRVTRAHDLRRRRDQAEADLQALAQSEDESRRVEARLREHRRAATVLPLLGPLREAETRLDRARLEADRARNELAPGPVPTDREACERSVSELQRRLGELEGLEPLVARLVQAQTRSQRLRDEITAATAELESARSAAETLPSRREACQGSLERARVAAAGLAEREQRCVETTARRSAAEAVPRLTALVAEVEAQARSAHEAYNLARSAHLDLVERRLRGAAAELAATLAPGQPCQVCGSTAHPEPAAPSPDAVTREEQDAAEVAADQARRDHELAQQRLAEARQQRELVQQSAAGLDLESAERAEGLAEEELRRDRAAAEQVVELEQQLAALEAAVGEADLAVERARERRDDLARRLAGAEEVVSETEPQVRGALRDELTLAQALDATRARLRLVQAAAESWAALEEATAHHDRCRRRTDEAARAAGFDTAELACDAALDDADVARLEDTLEQRQADLARARGVLDEPEVRALTSVDGAPQTAADLAEARGEVARAAAELHSAGAVLHVARQDHAALVALDDQVAAATATWVPAREEHELAESMSRLVRGTGGDNQLQMRLSSYVLATRLDQVLEAADERLQQMRDNRYTFHRAAGARARRRSGLDIEVLDDWTGELRAPTSLSGGETFKLSLALALGLADVISHESGGLHLETLFIDEGFGMLDPDTLDEVMDCIDDLRSGGRSVGVVSHVSELRARIGTQLHVTASRAGSHLRTAGCGV